MSIGVFETLNPTVTNTLALILVFVLLIESIHIMKIRITKFSLYYLIFVLVCFGSLFYALDYGFALEKFRLILFLAIISLFSGNLFKEKYDCLVLHYSLITTAFIMVVFMLVENGFVLPQNRYEGSLGNSNKVGLFISYGLVSALHNVVWRKKYGLLAFVPFLLIGVLFSGSRKALISVTFGIIFISYVLINENIKRGGKKRTFRAFLTLFFLIFSAVIFVTYFDEILELPIIYNTIGKRLEDFFKFVRGQGIDNSAYTRLLFIRIGLNKFKENPIFGYGINNFRVITLKYIPLGWATYAHNNLIEILFGVGLIGVIPFYYGILWLLNNLLKVKNKNNVNSVEEVMSWSFFTYFVLNTLTNDFAFVYYYDRITIFIFSVAATFLQHLSKKQTS